MSHRMRTTAEPSGVHRALEWLRRLLPADSRAQLYAITSALVAGLASWGVLDESLVPAVAGAGIAAVTLLYAILHATSTARTALYGLAAAVGVVLVALGVATDGQVESLLAVMAPVLGLSVAAATTGGGPDEYAGTDAAVS